MSDSSNLWRETPLGNTEFLVSKAKAGSESAWREIYRRYHTMLVAHAQARIPGFARRRFDGEDVLQQAFFQAWQGISGFEYRGDGCFRRWLATLVVNAFRNELKKDKERLGFAGIKLEDEKTGEEPPQSEAKGAPAAPEVDPERAAMLEALGQMDDEDRDILIQRYFEDLSFEAIAEVLHCSRESARTLTMQAMERLRRRMGA
ncbi:MAG: RNA polymerase sigma factor [Planctomycetes bacterium]|nr:RNA polymerase sigma factor [Planctomycetota bacterium]